MWVEAGVLHYMGHNALLHTLTRTTTADHNYQTRVKEVRSKVVIHYDNWQA